LQAISWTLAITLKPANYTDRVAFVSRPCNRELG